MPDAMSRSESSGWALMLDPEGPDDNAEYGEWDRENPPGPDETFCQRCGHLALAHTGGKWSVHGVCPDPTNHRDYADLLKRGYVPVQAHGTLRVGMRVAHRNQQWYAAAEYGTGWILAVLHKDPSAWARTYRTPDVEVIVQRDKPLWEGASIYALWANYHCQVARVQPTASNHYEPLGDSE